MILYEYLSKINNKYIIDEFTHGIALTYEDAIRKHKDSCDTVQEENFTCVIIRHNTEPLNKLDIDTSLVGIEAIEAMYDYCYKMVYELDTDYNISKSVSYFNISSYTIHHNIEKSLYNKYLQYTEGKEVRDIKTNKRYEIIQGSEVNEFGISRNYDYAYNTTMVIRKLCTNKFKEVTDLSRYELIN